MSASTSEPPLKRQRTDDDEQQTKSIPDLKKHDTLWFDDGNIILLANDTSLGFRLHRSILSVHSEVFRGMFAFPSNMEDNETMEGCVVVRLQDCGMDLVLFFTLLYYGAKHPFFNVDDAAAIPIGDIRSMVYLSFKYEVQLIQTTAVSLLRKYFPSDLESYDDSWEDIQDDLGNADLTSCITAVNLARKFHLPDILPVTLQECTVFALPRLLDPVSYGPSGSEQLSLDDARLCLRAVAQFDKAVRARLNIFTSFAPDKACINLSGQCTSMVKLLLQRLQSASVFTREMALRPIEGKFVSARKLIGEGEGMDLCHVCSKRILTEYNMCRTKLWDELPGIFGLEPSLPSVI